MRITDVRFALMRLSLFIDALTPEDRQNLTENLLAKSGFAHIPTDRAFGTYDDEGVDVVEALDRAAYILNDLTPEEETSYQADEELKPRSDGRPHVIVMLLACMFGNLLGQLISSILLH